MKLIREVKYKLKKIIFNIINLKLYLYTGIVYQTPEGLQILIKVFTT